MFKRNALLWRAVLVTLAVTLVVAACGGDAATTTVAADDVIFGEGSLPDTLPSDLPVPDDAVIGTTLVVRSTGTTEVILRLPVELPVAVAYFEQNLPARGFELLVNEARSETLWAMEIEREDLSGSIDLRAPRVDVTEVVMRFSTA